MDSNFIEHLPCDTCGSSDANSLYDDGHTYCFSCQAHEPGDGTMTSKPYEPTPLIPDGMAVAWPERRLSNKTCAKWEITRGYYSQEIKDAQDGENIRPSELRIFNYKRSDGTTYKQKVRSEGKGFRTHGEGRQAGLFGQHLWSDQGSKLIITEGEIDAASVSQVLSHKKPVVSVPNGAKGAKKAIISCFPWVNSFKEIVLFFDQDDAGREAAEEVAELFEYGRCKIVSFDPNKYDGATDANAMLMRDTTKAGEELITAIWSAEVSKTFKVSSALYTVDNLPELTPFGNAERFRDQHGDKVLYVEDMKSWAVWKGTHWKLWADLDAQYMMKQTIKGIEQEIQLVKLAVKKADEHERERLEKLIESLQKFRKASARGQAIEDALKCAKIEPDLRCHADDFDANPWLLNCQNCVVDLRDKSQQPHRKELKLSKIVSVDCVPSARVNRFKRFLHEVFDGDTELIKAVHLIVGYTLTGNVKEDMMFILQGEGGNGKSVLCELLRDIMGDYACLLETEVLLDRGGGVRKQEAIGRLMGKRGVFASETDNQTSWRTGLVKRLTGGDSLTGAALHKSSYEFQPSHKLWLSCNHLPSTRDNSAGFWRRVWVLPFNVQFSPEKRDQGLGRTLRATEAEAILAWAVAGAANWYERRKQGSGSGLLKAKAISAAVEEYNDDQDEFGRFVDECLEEKAGAGVDAMDLYTSFKTWNEANGGHPIPNTIFGNRMRERGFESKRVKEKGRKRTVWLGVDLVNNEPLF